MDIDDRIKALYGKMAIVRRDVNTSSIEIGRILIEKKASLPHGEYCSWVSANLPFSHATAWKYMKKARGVDARKGSK